MRIAARTQTCVVVLALDGAPSVPFLHREGNFVPTRAEIVMTCDSRKGVRISSVLLRRTAGAGTLSGAAGDLLRGKANEYGSDLDEMPKWLREIVLDELGKIVRAEAGREVVGVLAPPRIIGLPAQSPHRAGPVRAGRAYIDGEDCHNVPCTD